MSVQLQIGLLISLFGAGFVARRLGWLKPPHAGRMLQLVMNVGLPALLVASISRIQLTRDLLALPLSAVLISGLTLLVAVWVGRAMALPRPAQGAMVICSMSINNSFLFVFVLAAWGGAAAATGRAPEGTQLTAAPRGLAGRASNGQSCTLICRRHFSRARPEGPTCRCRTGPSAGRPTAT
jgi:hypothetical protein